MKYNKNEVKAGILVLISLLALGAFFITITNLEWEKKENTYIAQFGYIGGVDIGALVRFGGFPVGSVADMYISPDDNTKIEVTLKVDARTPVRVDSEAFISSIGLMGEYYIEITTGVQGAELLPSGSSIKSRDVLTLSQLGEPFMNLSAQLETLLINLNDVLNTENRMRLTNVLASTDSLFSTNAKEISGMFQNLNSLTRELQNISQKMDRLMGGNLQTMESTLRHLNNTLASADSLLSSFNQTTEVMNNLAISNQTSFYEMMNNFETMSQNLEQFSRTIKERPWMLVRKSAPSERKLP